MNRRSSALMTKPCPTGAPPATTCALTVDCGTNDGLMPDRNIATTIRNGHRLFAPSFLSDIRPSSSLRVRSTSYCASAAPSDERVVSDGRPDVPPHTCAGHVLLVDGSARARRP